MLNHRSPLTLRSKVYFFSTVIKGNDKCSNLQVNILSLHSEISLISCFGISNETWRTSSLICTDTQTGLRYLLFAYSKVTLFAWPPICFVSFLSLFACKHARNEASNTKFVNMAPIHWSSPQRRSQNDEKLWTSKGDYWIKP